MCSPISGFESSPRERGIALIITLILLSVITFLAVTFLAVSQREKAAVNVARDQTMARLAAETAVEHAVALVQASALATSNRFNFGLLVATNFINWDGFDPNPPSDADPSTNVNFFYRQDGQPLTPAQTLDNLNNLLFNPRPPVFITNRAAANSIDFRFFRDENRNGRYDTNGFWPVFDEFGRVLLTVDAAGNSIALTNHFVGDPEWIGVLERPEFPHSPTNRFSSRFTFFAMPIGNTLDINFIHNATGPATGDTGFRRNQGVGPWELNLAALLVDLNTNYWPGTAASYDLLDAGATLRTTGTSFDQARGFVNYRSANFNPTKVNPTPWVDNGGIDEYGNGPLMKSPDFFDDFNDTGPTFSARPDPRNYFTTQDFFDRNKVPGQFVDNLLLSAQAPSSYDRNTYYRLLEQVGVDSAPEEPGRIHLNYKNTGGVAATNFVPWIGEDFFTNAANAMVRRFSEEWLAGDPNGFRDTLLTNRAFGITNIPVLISNQFVYPASVNRLLQVAANILDASTNRYRIGTNVFPSVFRPVFQRQGDNVFVVGYREVGSVALGDAEFAMPVDLTIPGAARSLMALENQDYNMNVYGVPWIIGAKPGWPNFNEFAFASTFELTRKLEMERRTVSERGQNGALRMKYVLSLTNVIGVELWNSSSTNLNRQLEVVLDHDMAMVLTNDQGMVPRVLSPGVRRYLIPDVRNVMPNSLWRGYARGQTNSFFLPLLTNVPFLPQSTYVMGARTLVPGDNLRFESNQGFPIPRWGFNSTNRLRLIVRDVASGRVVDYVQLNGLDGNRDLSEEIRTRGYQDDGRGQRWEGMWNTNRPPSVMLPYEGITNQIFASIGAFGNNPPVTEWQNYGSFNVPGGSTVQAAIEGFRLFYLGLPGNTNLRVQVPFTPSARYVQYQTWQANDPLVHHLVGDLSFQTTSNGVAPVSLKAALPRPTNLGRVNDRYSPWGGNPERSSFGEVQTDPAAFDVARKDPGVFSSDAWEFHDGKFPHIGWLGRVHRGSPWQTIYLKSQGIGESEWSTWTGNTRPVDARMSRPVTDRLLLDVFTTSFSPDTARGRLSINQTNLAAWSAVFSGVIPLSNANNNARSPLALAPIQPVGVDVVNGLGPNSPLARIVDGIARTRSDTNQFPQGTFKQLGDILAVPELTDASPFLTNAVASAQFTRGLSDAVYEWLPQQTLGLLKLGTPRYVVFAYGQTLRPAPRSILVSGPYAGMVTNYQVTAEIATRSVLRVDGSPDPRDANHPDPLRRYPPRVVVESFNLLPPD